MYEDRVVLFLDILGFSQLVKSSENNILEIKKIKDAIRTIQDVFDINQTTQERVITQFSDSIVVSFLISEKGEIAFLLSKTHKLIKTLIAQEIICRGAITKGKMIHDENFMFGPAFIEAYRLEIKVANYPRIILIDESIIEIGVEYHGYHPTDDPSYEKTEINSFITKDFDNWDINQAFTMIQMYLTKHHKAKMGDFVNLFEGHITRRKIKYFVEKMLDADLLKTIGSGSGTRYILSDNHKERMQLINEAVQIGFEELKKRGKVK